jgi:preprotein translocase subunit SecG
MQTLIIVIHLMIVLSLIGFVLLQKSEGGGLGIGGGGGFLSSRGTSNVLSRTTAILAAAFFSTSLVLSIIAGMHRNPTSILQPTSGTPGAPNSSGAPTVPPSGGQPGSGGLLDQLQRQDGPAQPAAPTPGGPQVPKSQ